jgi:hypothetical protein
MHPIKCAIDKSIVIFIGLRSWSNERIKGNGQISGDGVTDNISFEINLGTTWPKGDGFETQKGTQGERDRMTLAPLTIDLALRLVSQRQGTRFQPL